MIAHGKVTTVSGEFPTATGLALDVPGWGRAVVTGKVIRFDQVRGYGFIAGIDGGPDIFLHMNDILDDKHRVGPGTLVEFDLEQAQRGPKACSVRIVESPVAVSAVAEVPAARADVRTGEDSENLCDVLSAAEFLRDVTELLLAVEPTLTAAQIVPVRQQFARFAQRHGWVED